MPDLEKVLQGLYYCTREYLERCNYDCPYFGVDGCADQVRLDALSLLKARRPRLMTLEEVEEAGGLIYYERKGEYGATPAYVYKVGEHSFDIMTMGNDGFQNEKSFDYKTGWRCWTSSPTDAQRRMEPWK